MSIRHTQHVPSLWSYCTGFLLSISLTLAAFALAFFHIESGHAYFTHDFLVYSIIGLALIQLFAQAVFFLHLSRNDDSRHNLISFILTIFIVLFIVIGSLWIMHNLKSNMTHEQMDAYLHKEN